MPTRIHAGLTHIQNNQLTHLKSTVSKSIAASTSTGILTDSTLRKQNQLNSIPTNNKLPIRSANTKMKHIDSSACIDIDDHSDVDSNDEISSLSELDEFENVTSSAAAASIPPAAAVKRQISKKRSSPHQLQRTHNHNNNKNMNNKRVRIPQPTELLIQQQKQQNDDDENVNSNSIAALESDEHNNDDDDDDDDDDESSADSNSDTEMQQATDSTAAKCDEIVDVNEVVAATQVETVESFVASYHSLYSLSAPLVDAETLRRSPLDGDVHSELVHTMFQSEIGFHPQCDYMTLTQHSGRLDWSMRAILLDWMCEVSSVLKLQHETCELACQYVDRYLSQTPQMSSSGAENEVAVVEQQHSSSSSASTTSVSTRGRSLPIPIHRSNLQLLGVTCLYIACKIDEIWPPSLADLVATTDSAYASRSVVRFERHVLSVLDWRLQSQTPCAFLKMLLRLLIDACMRDTSLTKYARRARVRLCNNARLYREAMHLITTSLLDHVFLHYYPSAIATSCLLLILSRAAAAGDDDKSTSQRASESETDSDDDDTHPPTSSLRDEVRTQSEHCAALLPLLQTLSGYTTAILSPCLRDLAKYHAYVRRVEVERMSDEAKSEFEKRRQNAAESRNEVKQKSTTSSSRRKNSSSRRHASLASASSDCRYSSQHSSVVRSNSECSRRSSSDDVSSLHSLMTDDTSSTSSDSQTHQTQQQQSDDENFSQTTSSSTAAAAAAASDSLSNDAAIFRECQLLFPTGCVSAAARRQWSRQVHHSEALTETQRICKQRRAERQAQHEKQMQKQQQQQQQLQMI